MKIVKSVGSEIEFCDVDRRKVELPEGCVFNNKEVTLVNSSGRAVNSKKDSEYFIGGEINVIPTQTIDEQLKAIERCLKALNKAGAPSVNYRCNQHFHICLVEELQTLESLKKIQSYAYDNFQNSILGTMGEGQFNKPKDMPMGTWKHYTERMVAPWRQKHLMEAVDLKDFQMSFFKNKKGTHASLTFHRQYVNTHSFFKTKTIEFRGYWGTLNLRMIENCLKFSYLFIDQALTDRFPVQSYINYFNFPPELPFDAKLEKGFIETKVEKPN